MTRFEDKENDMKSLKFLTMIALVLCSLGSPASAETPEEKKQREVQEVQRLLNAEVMARPLSSAVKVSHALCPSGETRPKPEMKMRDRGWLIRENQAAKGGGFIIASAARLRRRGAQIKNRRSAFIAPLHRWPKPIAAWIHIAKELHE